MTLRPRPMCLSVELIADLLGDRVISVCEIESHAVCSLHGPGVSLRASDERTWSVWRPILRDTEVRRRGLNPVSRFAAPAVDTGTGLRSG